MKKIIEGSTRFMTSTFAEKKSLFESLKSSQNPRALFITCSDSRVDPSLITQTDPGELFVIRNAGNIVPAHGAVDGGEAATIEYAMRVLGIRNIIVCGHSNCGAMKGLITEGATDSLPLVKKWLEHAETTRQIVLDRAANLSSEDKLARAIELNVLGQINNLITHPSVASALQSDELNIYGWVYRIHDGELTAFDPDTERFEHLSPEKVEARFKTPHIRATV